MVHRSYVAVTAAMLGLGLLHVTLTAPIYRALTAPALWFAGTGLLLVAAATANWVVIRTKARDEGIVHGVALLNGVCGVFAGFVVWVLPAPQSFAVLLLFGAATVLPGLLRRAEPGSSHASHLQA
jgi:hypothetical protein